MESGLGPEQRYGALKNLPIAKYRFQFVATSVIQLPVYKGSAFHGGFGHALKLISPTWYVYFFRPRREVDSIGVCPSKDELPKPFVLLPPLEQQTQYRPGETFACELTLLGEAAQHIALCHAALEQLGARMGLGSNRGRFRIEDVAAARPTQHGKLPISVPWNAAQSAAEIAESVPALQGDTIRLDFPTRLRLKAENRLFSGAPPLHLLLARLLGRLDTLGRFYGGGEVLGTAARAELLRHAEATVTIERSELRWEDWDRYSGRQQEAMKFGGLVGSIAYRGMLSPALPYLRVGEWTHIGGKTSFGLGKYVVTAQEERS